MAAPAAAMRLLVLASPDTPELSVLRAALPPGCAPLAVGRSLAELRSAGASDATLASCDVLLLCGVGANAAGREALAELLPHLSSLRWVHTASAGVNHLLCPALSEAKGVALTNARGIYSGSLAEWALFACAYFAKDLPRLLAAQAGATWAPYDVEELRGRTLGVVGFGDIGQATARLAQAYGMRVIATRRRAAPPEPGAPCDEFYALDRLPALMGASDYVVMATPLTPETTKLVSREAIAAMKPTGVFINIGRGPCVDEAALTEALQAGRIRGAALDVFEVEPLPASSALWGLRNALLSPHCADRTSNFQDDAMRFFAENAARFMDGQPLHNIVDKEKGY